MQYDYSPANPILEKYGQCQLSVTGLSSPFASRAPSRATSSSSLHHEVFHSAPGSGTGTPILSRKPSGLVMTTRDDSEAASSSSWFSFGSGLRTRRAPPTAEMLGTTATSMTTINGGEMTPRGLRRVRSLAELQQRLEQTQREIDSEDSIDESGSEEGATYDFDDQEPEAIAGTAVADGGGGETSEYWTSASTVASAISSKYSSGVVSRSASRDGSPNRSRRTIEPLTPTGAASKSARALDLEILVSRTPKVGAGVIFQPRANHAAAACLSCSHRTTLRIRTLAIRLMSRLRRSTRPARRGLASHAGGSATSSGP